MKHNRHRKRRLLEHGFKKEIAITTTVYRATSTPDEVRTMFQAVEFFFLIRQKVKKKISAFFSITLSQEVEAYYIVTKMSKIY